MGYMSIKGGKRTIDLSPNEAYYAKNSLGLNSFLEYKPLTGVNNFLSQAIFEAYKDKLKKDNELAKDYDILIEELKTKIANIQNLEQLNLYYSSLYNKHEKLWSSFKIEENLLAEKVKELNCEFDKKTKQFISNKKDETVEEAKKEVKDGN
jgi:hypothetical protein